MVDNYEAVRANYTRVGVAVMERMYSDDYLSIGGTASTDELAELAGIDASSTVLDVGSGLGGPALRLAERFGAMVTGMDLVDTSVAESNDRARDRGLSDRVKFEVGDATAMPFPDDSFSVVWGQDAWCHVPDTEALVSECARVLQPTGAIAFSDWVLASDGDAPGDVDLRDRALAAAASPHMATAADYRSLLAANGFVDVIEADISDVFVSQYELIVEGLQAIEGQLVESFSQRVFDTVSQLNGDVLAGFRSGDIGGARFVARLSAAAS